MKTMTLLAMLLLTPATLLAEDATEISTDMVADSDSYADEIRAACEAEAAGLADADIYIQDCIEAMKQSFNQ